jgi:hypothetical protein
MILKNKTEKNAERKQRLMILTNESSKSLSIMIKRRLQENITFIKSRFEPKEARMSKQIQTHQ